MAVAKGCGWENEEMLVKEYKGYYAGWISSEDLMYNLVTIANNTILYTWKLLRELSFSVFTTHTKIVTMWGDRYIN